MSVRTIHPIALTIVREEHRHLAAVMHSMLYLTQAIEQGQEAPDLKLFRAMLFYIIEFPDRVHHPKEDQFLFAKIKERTHQLDQALDTLSAQHVEGEQLVQKLLLALLNYELTGAAAFANFNEMAKRYCQFYFSHMQIEEEHILPVAQQVLNDADWKIVDEAFLENRKAMDDAGALYRYEQLFAMISFIAPSLAANATA